MSYLPKPDLVWQMRPEKYLELTIASEQVKELVQWVNDHLPSMSDTTGPRNGQSCVIAKQFTDHLLAIKVYCPDRKFKMLLKLTWGGTI